MSRVYTVAYQGTLTAAGTDSELFYLKPAADKPIRLRGFRLAQFSEIGDAQEENIRVSLIFLPATVTASSTGGSAVTPVDVDTGANSTAGFTARCNDTTVATTSGTARTLEELAWNERNTPCEFRWLDEREMPVCANAAALVVRNQTTVGDDLSIAITAWVEELP
jgi:hypothetical protein